jgi:predicted nucleic acid-binding protein
MNGVLADTSVWIDFFNGIESREKNILKDFLVKDKPVFLVPVVMQEILQGFRDGADFNKAVEILCAFPFLEYDPHDMAVKAAGLYREVRKKGITIRKSNDCLIAAIAIEHRIPLLHKDNDFNLMAKLTKLKIYSI